MITNTTITVIPKVGGLLLVSSFFWSMLVSSFMANLLQNSKNPLGAPDNGRRFKRCPPGLRFPVGLL